MGEINFRLRRMGLSLRVAATILLIILGGGYAAAVQHMFDHYENKDERPGMSMDDVTGSFHGVNSEATMIVAINTTMREHLTDGEHAALLEWLQGSRISEDYDNLDLGENAPADIIDRNCLDCHSRNAQKGDGIGARMPLEYWDDIKPLAFSKQFDPVPLEILTISTHTHALSMGMVTALTALLFLGTGWSCRWRNRIIALTFLALLADLSSWWLARWCEPFCTVLIVAGGVYGALLVVQLVGTFIDIWFGRLAPRKE